MISISQDQTLDRWETLPDVLREAIVSEANSDFVWKTCADEHVPEERTGEAAKVTGYVLLGFLHPEDVAQELKERLNIDPKTANLIEDSLNKRIFAPLRTDIDKIYSPVSKLEMAAPAPTPKILNDIPAVMPTFTPKPPVVSDVGWSRKPAPPAVPMAPTIKPDALQVSWIVPAATPKPMSADAASAAGAAVAPSEPAPVMLHQDTTFKAPEKNAGFTLTRPGSGAEVTMGQPSAAPSRPAVLEFGGAQQAQPKPPTPTPPPAAVHYTAFTEGPRNVSQVSPSAPPSPPIPPQPPQKNNTVVKDFL
jgi:hypothetical protein